MDDDEGISKVYPRSDEKKRDSKSLGRFNTFGKNKVSAWLGEAFEIQR
jgi:hypothetical protein